MAKIITVTANTAIDLWIEVDFFQPGETISAKDNIEFACGKGINVAKAVESLDYPVLCLGFIGSQSAGLFAAITSDRLKTELIAVPGKTRSNITLSESVSDRETHIRTRGFSVTPTDCQRLSAAIESRTSPGDIIVISGSLPPGAPDDLYKTIIAQCRQRSVTTILDTSGPALKAGIEAQPDILKPNHQELEALIGNSLVDECSIADAARSLIKRGIRQVYVSRGEQGCIAVDSEMSLSACLVKTPKNIVSKVGCGDALVAGLAVAMLQGLDTEAALRLGIACGTANLYSKEPGRFENVNPAEIECGVNIETID